MSRSEREADAGSKKACCVVSEFLEEAGFDRAKARRLKRQVLEGIVLMCRWELDRMQAAETPAPKRRDRPRRVKVE